MLSKLITLYIADERVYKAAPSEGDYIEVEVSEMPQVETKELHDSELRYIDGEFVTVFTFNANKAYGRINDLKAELKATDYKALKIWECNQLGQAEPYDKSVLERRSVIRTLINGIESEINRNGGEDNEARR